MYLSMSSVWLTLLQTSFCINVVKFCHVVAFSLSCCNKVVDVSMLQSLLYSLLLVGFFAPFPILDVHIVFLLEHGFFSITMAFG